MLHRKDLQQYIPTMAQNVKGMDLHKWAQLVDRKLEDIQGKTAADCRAMFLGTKLLA